MASLRIATLTLNPALDFSATTERVMPGHKLRCDETRYDPGGGGINVARAVHKLGGDAIAVYPSGGPYGAIVEGLLGAEQVPQTVVPIAGRTRESVTVLERSTGAQFRFVMPGPDLSPAEQADCLSALMALDPPPAFLVVSGSMPEGVGPDMMDRLRALSRDLRAKLVVDTSGDALAQVRGAYLIKPSLSELSNLVGRALQTEPAQLAAARQLVEEGRAEVVVLSLGDKGALLATAETARRFFAPAVPVRSTVGAGNSLLAGILVALAEGKDIVKAVQFGVAAGSAALMHPGTELCSREDTERLAAGIASSAPALSAA